MQSIERLVATIVIWMTFLGIMLAFFLGYKTDSDFLVAIVMVVMGSMTVGATIAVWQSSAFAASEATTKRKREELSRVERLANLLDDGQILELEELLAKQELRSIHYDN
jgi:hypothetical protein